MVLLQSKRREMHYVFVAGFRCFSCRDAFMLSVSRRSQPTSSAGFAPLRIVSKELTRTIRGAYSSGDHAGEWSVYGAEPGLGPFGLRGDEYLGLVGE